MNKKLVLSFILFGAVSHAMNEDLDEFPENGSGKFNKGTAIEHSSHPRIMDKMAQFLVAHAHSCVSIIGTKNHEFKWCQQDVCPETIARQDMTQRDNEAMLFAEKLKKEGHTCVRILESYPAKISWCNSTPCKNHSLVAIDSKKDAQQQSEDIMLLAENLRKHGHTCVAIREKHPPSISWCSSHPCSKTIN